MVRATWESRLPESVPAKSSARSLPRKSMVSIVGRDHEKPASTWNDGLVTTKNERLVTRGSSAPRARSCRRPRRHRRGDRRRRHRRGPRHARDGAAAAISVDTPTFAGRRRGGPRGGLGRSGRTFRAGARSATVSLAARSLPPAGLVAPRAVEGAVQRWSRPSALALLVADGAAGRARARARRMPAAAAGGAWGRRAGRRDQRRPGWEWVCAVNAPVGLAASRSRSCAAAGAASPARRGSMVPARDTDRGVGAVLLGQRGQADGLGAVADLIRPPSGWSCPRCSRRSSARACLLLLLPPRAGIGRGALAAAITGTTSRAMFLRALDVQRDGGLVLAEAGGLSRPRTRVIAGSLAVSLPGLASAPGDGARVGRSPWPRPGSPPPRHPRARSIAMSGRWAKALASRRWADHHGHPRRRFARAASGAPIGAQPGLAIGLAPPSRWRVVAGRFAWGWAGAAAVARRLRW